MTVPGSLFFVSSLAIATALSAPQPAHAQKWLAWGGPSPLQVDPAKKLTEAPPQAKPTPLLERVDPAIATPPPAGVVRAKPQPPDRALEPAMYVPATAPRADPQPLLERVGPAITTRPRAVASRPPPRRYGLAPALTNPAVSIEPLPPPDHAMQTTGFVNEPGEADEAPSAAIGSVQISPCDEISRCDRLEVVRSGVGVEGPKDEATKQRPAQDTKRNVLQSVRSIW